MAKQSALDDKMLAIMNKPETKATGLKIKLELVDGSKRKGTYLDLVSDPLNRPDYKDVQFIVFDSNQPEAGTKVWLPITTITTIEWSY